MSISSSILPNFYSHLNSSYSKKPKQESKRLPQIYFSKKDKASCVEISSVEPFSSIPRIELSPANLNNNLLPNEVMTIVLGNLSKKNLATCLAVSKQFNFCVSPLFVTKACEILGEDFLFLKASIDSALIKSNNKNLVVAAKRLNAFENHCDRLKACQLTKRQEVKINFIMRKTKNLRVTFQNYLTAKTVKNVSSLVFKTIPSLTSSASMPAVESKKEIVLFSKIAYKNFAHITHVKLSRKTILPQQNLFSALPNELLEMLNLNQKDLKSCVLVNRDFNLALSPLSFGRAMDMLSVNFKKLEKSINNDLTSILQNGQLTLTENRTIDIKIPDEVKIQKLKSAIEKLISFKAHCAFLESHHPSEEQKKEIYRIALAITKLRAACEFYLSQLEQAAKPQVDQLNEDKKANLNAELASAEQPSILSTVVNFATTAIKEIGNLFNKIRMQF